MALTLIVFAVIIIAGILFGMTRRSFGSVSRQRSRHSFKEFVDSFDGAQINRDVLVEVYSYLMAFTSPSCIPPLCNDSLSDVYGIDGCDVEDMLRAILTRLKVHHSKLDSISGIVTVSQLVGKLLAVIREYHVQTNQ